MKAIKAASAREKVADAEKALAKRSFFKASPDYYTAESKFKAAALDFKLCGELDNAIDALTRAADCSEHNKDKYTAATHLEAAANIAQGQRATKGMLEKALGLFDRACALYSESNNVSGAIELKFRIGRSLYQADPEQSAKFLLQACQLIDPNRNDSIAIDVFALAMNVLVRLRRLPEALKQVKRFSVMCRRIGRRDQLYKNNLTQTILMCAMGDFAGANEAFMDHMQDDDYLQQAEAATAEDLIEAFSKHDALKLKQVQAGRGFKFLENEVAKFAIKMTMGMPPPAAAGDSAAAAAAAAAGGTAAPRTQHGDLANFAAAPSQGDGAAAPPSLPRPAATPDSSGGGGGGGGAARPAPAAAAADAPAPAPAPAVAAEVVLADDEEDSDDGLFA